MNSEDLDRLLQQVGRCINYGDLSGAILVIIRAIKEANGEGVISIPPGGCFAVENLYVENGKLRVEYDDGEVI